MEAPARPHRRLIWKYTAVVVTLVAAAIVSVGLTELYFAYQDSKTGLDPRRTGQGVNGSHVDRAADAGDPAGARRRSPSRPWTRGRAGLDERHQDFSRVLVRRGVRRPAEVPGLGREGAGPHLAARDRPYRQRGRLLQQPDVHPRAGGAAVLSADVYFERRLAAAHDDRRGRDCAWTGRGGRRDRPELRPRRSSTERAIGTTGYAYAVNSRGVLVAHPDINLVLRHTSFASLPQVRAALRGPAESSSRRGDDRARSGRDESAQRLPDRSSRSAGASSSRSR